VNRLAEDEWEKGILLIREKLLMESILNKVVVGNRFNFGVEEL
jgi:hypothetical protein